MKIPGDISKVAGVYEVGKTKGKVNRTGGVLPKKDVVSLSKSARDYQIALKAVREQPDIRQSKVDEIKHRYETGTYNVSGKEIVEKMTRSILDKKI